MNLHFYFLIIIILLTRLYLMRDSKAGNPLTFLEFLGFALVPSLAIAMVYKLTWGMAHMVSILFAISFLQFLGERLAHSKWKTSATGINFVRLLSFLAAYFFVGLWSIDRPNLLIHPLFSSFLSEIQSLPFMIAPFAQIGWDRIGITVMGFLLVVNEVNILFRFIFDLFGVSRPGNMKSAKNGTDEREYNTGRLIGILERTIVYFLVIIGKYEAIGFIMAAKAFTRFKELEDRAFAEYVLIGTLLSIALSVGVALFVSQILRVTS